MKILQEMKAQMKKQLIFYFKCVVLLNVFLPIATIIAV